MFKFLHSVAAIWLFTSAYKPVYEWQSWRHEGLRISSHLHSPFDYLTICQFLLPASSHGRTLLAGACSKACNSQASPKYWLNLILVFQLYIGKPLFFGRDKNEILQQVCGSQGQLFKESLHASYHLVFRFRKDFVKFSGPWGWPSLLVWAA